MVNDRGLLTRVLSRPVKIHWAGWETDTYSMQQNGWQLSAEQDLYNSTIRLAARHPGHRMACLSELSDLDYYKATDPHYTYEVRAIGMRSMIGREDTVIGIKSNFSVFSSIDAIPQIVQIERARMEDFIYFAPLSIEQEIVVPEETVPDLLARILQMQQPAMHEHYRGRVLEERASGLLVPRRHAQIISLSKRAG